MFGSLKNTLKNSWYQNSDNHIIRLSTEIENSMWQIFSVYTIPETNDYIQTNFTNNEEFKNFTNLLIGRSIYNFNTSITENDYILTLSTCHKTNERIVVHAKLIKKEVR
jgi:sortase B